MPVVKAKVQSRNTTPLSTGSVDQVHGVSQGRPTSPSSMSYDDLLENYCRDASPPSSTVLKKIASTLRTCSEIAKQRSDACDRGMRELTRRKQRLLELKREQELAERDAEREEKERLKKAKAKKDRAAAEERPLAVGAHSVTRQDGGDSSALAASKTKPREPSENDSKAEPQRKRSVAESVSSNESHQPAPAPAIPQFQTFGPDPSKFDDPTIYHIRDILPEISEEQRKEIYGVADYPHDDLHDLTCGTPPDKDFSNAKPPNQVTPSTFINYLEPYVRPLTEEDIAFLKERGDRVTPFITPRRGQKSYKDIWAEEDGQSFGDNTQTAQIQVSNNQPVGSMDNMNDDVAETNQISTGPMLARLLATMRPELRQASSETTANGDAMQIDGDGATDNGNDDGTSKLPPPTYFTESTQASWKIGGPKMDYAQMEDKVKAELRYIGFLSEDAEPDYDGHHDDEVAARLRYLQEELQRVSILNGARKARVLELVEERMARQEWSAIADDLDTQVNQGYLKRHRNIGKGKKNLKRPGGIGGGSHPIVNGLGASKPGLGEQLKMLIERRENWNNLLGPVVEFGKTAIPSDTIFDEDNMKRIMVKEREGWSEAQDQA